MGISKADQFSGVAEFVTTARQGSFTAAAATLGLTKSAVGKTVARLERRLGTQLFHRTTRKLGLTADGATFLSACTIMMGELESARNVIGAGLSEPVGRVRIDVPGAFGRLYVMPILTGLMERYADLALSVTFTDRRVDPIEEGIDLVVRVGAPPDTTDLAARQVGSQTLVVCGAPAYLARHSQPKQREDLADHRCIVGRRNRPRHAWLLMKEDGTTERYPVNGHHELEDGEAMLCAAVAGHGLAQLPTWLAHTHFGSGSLVRVLPGLSGGSVPISAIWVNTRQVPRRIQVVVEALTQGLSTLPE